MAVAQHLHSLDALRNAGNSIWPRRSCFSHSGNLDVGTGMKENSLFRPTPAESARLNRIVSIQSGKSANVVPGAQPGRSVVLTKPAAGAVARPSAPSAHLIQTLFAAPAIRLPTFRLFNSTPRFTRPFPRARLPQPCISGLSFPMGLHRTFRPRSAGTWISRRQGDGDRPKWRKHLIRHATDHYNNVHNTSHPPTQWIRFAQVRQDPQVLRTIRSRRRSQGNSATVAWICPTGRPCGMCQSVMTTSNACHTM